ncbi:MAG: SDR family oxidoreductase [Cyanobacteriota bacterium]|nr:SDR family oxidoreductase [Cyanobacteriota bacterium]
MKEATKTMGSVLLTGAAGGIGQALVAPLQAWGWRVIAVDQREASANGQPRQEAEEWIVQDLAQLSTDAQALRAFITQVMGATTPEAPLQAIVHNAAVQHLGSFEKLSQFDWSHTMAVNLLAPVAISRALLPQLLHQNGSIVHIGSIHSQLTKPGFTAYATSKAALAGLTRAMAVELGGSVRVNAIEPAAIATPMLEAGFADAPELKAQLEAFHPTGAIGSPGDVARAVLFLLDPANRFLNGCLLPLGGGIHSRLHDPA